MFFLNPNSPIPIYLQLYNQIRDHVLTGKLKAQVKLPSVRHLASELCVSRNTVEGAYQELLAEGYIYSRDRSGYFVSPPDQDLLASPRPAVGPETSRRPEPALNCRYDFHPARLDPDSFPTALWRRCLLDSLRACGQELTRYGDPRGEPELRSQIRNYLEQSRGVLCARDQVVICSGLQHSLEIVAQLLKASHPLVAVEDPGYHLPRSVFGNNGFGLLPVPVGPAGLDLELLKASGSRIAYVTPSHQLPMGCVMPETHRLTLIEWAETGGNFIIEDDYDSELRYHGKPIPSLQGLRPDGNVIYLGTFSKVLSPALRLSYLVLPAKLLGRYQELHGDRFCPVSLLEQKAMSRFMEQGHWNRHLRRMRTLYRKKHDHLVQAIDRHFGDRGTLIGQGAGLHVVLELRAENVGEVEIIGRAAGAGIGLFPFSTMSVTGESTPTRILLGFGGMSLGDTEEGIALLSTLCF